MKDIDESEQYALLAAKTGFYPCYNCTVGPTIFLLKGEVWKYGYTRLSEKGRYGNWHIKNDLEYIPQFFGTISECAKEEKRKIYNYPILRENLARIKPLDRPPGNKKD